MKSVIVGSVALLVIVPSGCRAFDYQMPVTGGDSTICRQVENLIDSGSARDHYVKSKKIPNITKGLSYLEIDLDGDGENDQVHIVSGSGEAFLSVDTSTGVHYEHSDGLMVPLRFQGGYYILTTYRDHPVEGRERIAHKLYKLVSDGLDDVCDIWFE